MVTPSLTNTPWPRSIGPAAGAVALVALALLPGSGCTTKHPTLAGAAGASLPAASRGPVAVSGIIGIDDSGSQSAALNRSKDLATGIAALLHRGEDHLSVYRAGHTVEEVYDNVAPRRREAFSLLLDASFPAPDGYIGTFPRRFYQAVAAEGPASGRPWFAVLIGDGENSDETEATRLDITVAATVMARDPNFLAFVVYGVSPDQRATLQKCLAPLGKRLFLYGPNETDIRPLIGTVDDARTAAQTH